MSNRTFCYSNMQLGEIKVRLKIKYIDNFTKILWHLVIFIYLCT